MPRRDYTLKCSRGWSSTYHRLLRIFEGHMATTTPRTERMNKKLSYGEVAGAQGREREHKEKKKSGIEKNSRDGGE